VAVARPLARWAPVALWAGLQFAASAQSDVGVAGLVPDWLTHGASYLVLAVLLAHGVSGGLFRPLSGRAALAIVCAATAYGMNDEWHQSFVPGRDPSAADVAKDAGGATAGVLLVRAVAERRASARARSLPA
jgi:VanZ family protein